MLAMPTCAQSEGLALTSQGLPGSSPTSSVPSPGGCPAAVSAATRSVSSVRIAAAVALPSRIVAGTPDSVPDAPPTSGRAPAALRSGMGSVRSRWDPPPADRRRSTMSEREQTPFPSGSRSAQDDPGQRPADEAWRDQTTPGLSPVTGGSTAVGSGAHGYVGPGENYYTTPQYSTQPVKIRRADALAALLLILAGIAAGGSLLLSWLPKDASTGSSKGLDILKLGFTTIR